MLEDVLKQRVIQHAQSHIDENVKGADLEAEIADHIGATVINTLAYAITAGEKDYWIFITLLFKSENNIAYLITCHEQTANPDYMLAYHLGHRVLIRPRVTEVLKVGVPSYQSIIQSFDNQR